MEINFRPGDTIRVYEKIKEEEKTRTAFFEGVVIAIRGSGINKSFTVRKIGTGNIGIERIWPIQCPSISKIVVKKKGKVRRAKIYYLRKRVGKEALAVEKGSEKEKNLSLPSQSETTLGEEKMKDDKTKPQ